MQNIKEIVDKYLIQNFETINKDRELLDFRWMPIAHTIWLSLPDKERPKTNIHPEYIRKRFVQLRKKKEKIIINSIAESNITQAEVLNNNVSKQKIDNLNATISAKFQYQTGKESKEKGTKEWTFTASTIPTEEEIIEHFNIDTKKWKIVNIYHKTSFGGKYSVTVQTNLLKGI